MKKTSLLILTLLSTTIASAGDGLLSFNHVANSKNLTVSSDGHFIAHYTVKNNTATNLQLLISWLGDKNVSLKNNCNDLIQAQKTCDIDADIPMGTTMGPLQGTLQVYFGYRSPLSSTLSLEKECSLLPVHQYQSNFCQQQYARVTLNTQGVFNTSNKNVVNQQRVGGIFGTYQQGKQCYVSCGYSDLKHNAQATEKTVFELASITKSFTATLLGVKQHLNTIDVLTSVVPNLPPGFNLQPNEQAVTYLQLATFSGGFYYSDPPTKPHTQLNFQKDINALDPALPPAKAVYQGAALPTENVYSNTSYGLLGQILAHIDFPGASFDPKTLNALYCDKIFNTLQMRQSNVCMPTTTNSGNCQALLDRCTYQSGWQSSMAFTPGFTIERGQFKQAPFFPWVPWGAAGAIHSNAEDMVKYIKLYLGHTDGSPEQQLLYQGAMNALTSNNYLPVPFGQTAIINQPYPNSLDRQAYAWVEAIPPTPKLSTVYFKDGGHQGFNSWIGLSPSKDYGVIILFNTGSLNGTVSQLNTHIPTIGEVGLNIVNQS